MLKVGDRVRVIAKIGGPDLQSHLAARRLEFWGLVGRVTHVLPKLDRPIMVEILFAPVPSPVRFWERDLLEV